ncbi:OB-fold domain-containing protein [Nocardia abscessus]|uniref:OB-fold domain-containing protein n=1 Tax=Nocardia abscessus TaxID=120957 RepID=UPI002454CF21|nr:OB-fold domain-containing protein [Nocardia abscessus]
MSWQVVDRAPVDRPGELVPLTIAFVELDEGPWVYTSIEGEIPLSPSRPVRVRFQPTRGMTGSPFSRSVPNRGTPPIACPAFPLASDRGAPTPLPSALQHKPLLRHGLAAFILTRVGLRLR